VFKSSWNLTLLYDNDDSALSDACRALEEASQAGQANEEETIRDLKSKGILMWSRALAP